MTELYVYETENWQWYHIDGRSNTSRIQFPAHLSELTTWLQDAGLCQHNHIVVSERDNGDAILYGTLMYAPASDAERLDTLHFWITDAIVVTYTNDIKLYETLQTTRWRSKLRHASDAPETFFTMISCLLDNFHQSLDDFEVRLAQLEQRMRNNNGATLMRSIFERRHDLLHWHHQFIAIQELYYAAQEAFYATITERVAYNKTGLKLDRVGTLLKHYSTEIDTLIAMDSAISTFRGNDIMKTLTIFTAVFTPAMVVGGLWGMNFQAIPLFGWQAGFYVMIALIVVSTAVVYWWLWRKGWTGDLLNEHQVNKTIPPKR